VLLKALGVVMVAFVLLVVGWANGWVPFLWPFA
jgi:hypothetical protein